MGSFNEYLISWSTGTISTWVDSLSNWWEGDIHTIWSSKLKKACCTCSCNVIWNNDLDPIRQNKETTRVYVYRGLSGIPQRNTWLRFMILFGKHPYMEYRRFEFGFFPSAGVYTLTLSRRSHEMVQSSL